MRPLWAALACLPAIAWGQDVTLRSGDLAVTGRLTGYDGGAYELETTHGPLTLEAAAVTCEGAGCPGAPRIVMEGDPALLDVLVPALIEAFGARRGVVVERTGRTYHLEDRGDALAIELRSGKGGDLSVRWGSAAPDGPRRVLALEAVVAIVSARNPVGAVAPDELARLFAGEIDWTALGGPDGPVALHVLDGVAAETFEARVLSHAGVAPSGEVIRHRDSAALMQAVASSPRAVGITTLGGVGAAEPLALAGPCGLVSRPGPDAARAGDWPLTVPLTAILPARPMPRLAADLALFATSSEAQGVVRRAGVLDQSTHAIPLAEQGERLAAAILAAGEGTPIEALRGAIGDLRGLTRLTPTFRFEAGSRLDAGSLEAVERLAARIAAGAHDGRRLVFVGFGDGAGPPERTLALSRARARAVLEAVRARVSPRPDGPILSAEGHGAVLPVACKEDSWGPRLNRRVELWTPD